MKSIQIHPQDNVLVALSPLEKGETLQGVTALENVPQGHKMALRDIRAGENVIKYGFPIGHALQDIPAGSWVHTHNVKTNLAGEMDYTYQPADAPLLTAGEKRTFRGFMRPDGRAAIRNEIWIIPTVGCVNSVAEKLVRDNQHLVSGSVEGLYTFTHPYGCSQMGEDHENTRKLLAALCRHPNAGGVLVLSLGCENLTLEQFQSELGQWDDSRVKFLVCQDVEDEYEEGAKLLEYHLENSESMVLSIWACSADNCSSRTDICGTVNMQFRICKAASPGVDSGDHISISEWIALPGQARRSSKVRIRLDKTSAGQSAARNIVPYFCISKPKYC